ncbi:Beta-glucanase/ glucan synthase [Paracholeplasma brassicae]|uniref:Beta-glucanase/ glucan synthase n=1 Tax=Acholeplasma brassicae TaxID=61635 RepID=U4KNB3_9MOLU|nr:glycoside hydrolase family 16 protein [Paracholeplasma brassicae]CCV65812.1 Beta-glucanase/ glucan synthase [Paracholeplasma brassicae]
MYKLVWEDLFKNDGLPDESIWTFETGGHGFGNHEQQHYTNRLENCYIKDGILTIEAKKETYQGNDYTSSKLITYNKKPILYGKVKVMAELPTGRGTWPAIWFLGNSFKEGTPWPDCGEIDLLEHVGSNLGQVHFSLHTKKHNHLIKTQPTFFYKDEGLLSGFHEYQMVWDESQISFYVDDVHKVTFKKEEVTIDDHWPFSQPHYLILNLAMGGWWGGEIDDTALPQKFRFKYVKVYERCEK